MSRRVRERKINELSNLYKNSITPIYFDLSKEEEIKSATEKIKKRKLKHDTKVERII